MEHKIINTKDYLLIVDELEIKEGDWLYGYMNNNMFQANKLAHLYINSKKIIAHLPLNNSQILKDIDILPPIEENVFLYPIGFNCKMVDFEVDMGLGEECVEYSQYPKTTTNSQGNTQWVGEYIYD